MPSRTSRDLGLHRIRVSTRFLAAGSLVAGGALSLAVAKALPGKASHDRTTATVARSSSGTSSAGTSASSTTGSTSTTTTTPSSSLSTPTESPQSATGSTPVVSSGGS